MDIEIDEEDGTLSQNALQTKLNDVKQFQSKTKMPKKLIAKETLREFRMSRTKGTSGWANKGPRKIREDANADEERCQVSRLNIENTRGKWHLTLQRDKAAAGVNRGGDDDSTDRSQDTSLAGATWARQQGVQS
ncbi:hypothetical protein WN51_03934 [Melipona quadrifasciata]|uniref:Uncharacterized protein n=1 Tax=Melipona quadrifasciata TaxID=166423 RepID=A0A0N0BCB1_9HYME|nr:hypothetical protein WN51_03934 [Melipona quadrifasciata]